nr:hypothetical protein [Anaerolineae bacterium]
MLSEYKNFTLLTGSPIPAWHVIVDDVEERHAVAFRINDETVSLMKPSTSVDRTTQPDRYDGFQQAISAFDDARSRSRVVHPAQLRPKPNTRVHWVKPAGRRVSEADIEPIQQFFSRPVVEMSVNDPYLLDYERLYHRLSNYIRLGAAKEKLEKVLVYTRDAQAMKHDRTEQNRAIDALKNQFSALQITVNRATHSQAHDRWIEIVRDDRSKARLYIGRGLDFIRADGTVQETYLVLEEIGL